MPEDYEMTPFVHVVTMNTCMYAAGELVPLMNGLLNTGTFKEHW